MKSWSRPYSGGDWESAGSVRTNIMRQDGKMTGIEFQFDTAPRNERSRMVAVQLDAAELLRHTILLHGGTREQLIERLLKDDAKRHVETREELAKTYGEIKRLQKELDRLSKLRVIGGAV